MNPHAPEQLPFFVYGTLLPGQPNENLWGGRVTKAEPAFIDNCQLFDMGFYPMLVAQQNGTVSGQVITVDNVAYENILFRLDALEEYFPEEPERSTYFRVRKQIRTENGRTLDAWVYEGAMDLVNGMSLITSGDWLAYARGKENEIETWWNSINTMFGHHKEVNEDE